MRTWRTGAVGLAGAVAILGTFPASSLSATEFTVAYSRMSQGTSEIFLTDDLGNSHIQVTDGPLSKVTPEWSPDGQFLAFGMQGPLVRPPTSGGLVISSSDGTMTAPATSCPTDDHPTWSPDGESVAFLRQRGKVAYFHLLDVSTGRVHPTRLSPSGQEGDLDWSPISPSIAFVDNAYIREDGRRVSQIWIMGDDGSEAEPLTDGTSNNLSPSWSPDGTRLLFSSDRDGDFDLYVLEIATGATSQLSDAPSDQLEPAWSEDDEILFVSDHTGNREIYRTPIGSPLEFAQQLTQTEEDEYDPAWRPDEGPITPPFGSVQRCAVRHPRRVSLERTRLFVSGSVTVHNPYPDGFSGKCLDTRVVVEERRSGGWSRLTKGRSKPDGTYRLPIPTTPRRLRAVLPRFSFFTPEPADPVKEICSRAVSPTRR